MPPIKSLRHRKRRHALFQGLMSALKPPIKILDVGGTIGYWKSVGFDPDDGTSIVLLNIVPQEAEPPFVSIVGNGMNMSYLGDNSFDIVFSNSTINMIGTFENQVCMASEIRRVGKRYFVQSPNRYFPIDWRTLLPCFHFLPEFLQAWCFLNFKSGMCRRSANSMACMVRDLSVGDIKYLFPGADVVSEKFMGLNKSYVVMG